MVCDGRNGIFIAKENFTIGRQSRQVRAFLTSVDPPESCSQFGSLLAASSEAAQFLAELAGKGP